MEQYENKKIRKKKKEKKLVVYRRVLYILYTSFPLPIPIFEQRTLVHL